MSSRLCLLPTLLHELFVIYIIILQHTHPAPDKRDTIVLNREMPQQAVGSSMISTQISNINHLVGTYHATPKAPTHASISLDIIKSHDIF
jgi:hypothetical protein